jgi:cyclic beta-1,2-glucan synthetase
MAFVELDSLELYAENISANLSSSKMTRSGKIRRMLSRKLTAIKAVTDKISEYRPPSSKIPKEFEWLLDNRYIAEREGRGSLLMLKRAGKLPGPKKGYPKIFGLAVALVDSGNGAITNERIAAFIAGAQKAGAFSEKELWLFVVMLKAALVIKLFDLTQSFPSMLSEYNGARKGIFSAELNMERIRGKAEACPTKSRSSPEMRQERHIEYSRLAENIFTSLRLLSNTDFRELLHKLSAVGERPLPRSRRNLPLMDEESRSQYRRIVSRLARRHKSSEASIAEQAIKLSEESSDPRCRHVGTICSHARLASLHPGGSVPYIFHLLY